MQQRNVLHSGGRRAALRGQAVVRKVRRGSEERRVRMLQERRLYAGVQYCQEITRREARNFYWGFVALPKPQRVAIYALYSFSRQVDDDVDLGDAASGAPAASSISIADHFAMQRRRVTDCYSGNASDPVMLVMSRVVNDYRIPPDELLSLVRGVEMDLEGRRYGAWPELEEYCHHVASSVGRMCTRIFGSDDPVALARADDLGVAMQITNILRDVREDFELGRVYLPQDELSRFGVREADLGRQAPPPGWTDLVRLESRRAQSYFDSGLGVTEFIPRRAAVCVLTMAGMYRSILNQIAEDPSLPLRRRASLRKRTKLKVMLRSWLRAV